MASIPRRGGDRPPAIVLGGDVNAASVARSLGAAGIAVHALGTGAADPVRDSRFCTSYVRFERGEDLQGRWSDWLQDHASRLAGAVLLACNDDALELIAGSRAMLEELGYRPFEADDEVLATMLDKRRTAELAARIGVPAPRSMVLEGRESLEPAAARIGFPCGLKPLHAHVLARHPGWGKLIIARDAAHLRELFEQLDALGVRLLATEIIPGEDDCYRSYYSYMDADGRPLLHFTKQKLRGYPPRMGLWSYHLTTRDPDVIDSGLRFFQRAGVRGLANVEFKLDPRDGVLKLIECNHRFTAANEIVRLAGLDLALLTYERALGRPGPDVSRYRTGMRLLNPIEDVRAFQALRGEGKLSTAGWLRSLAHPLHTPLLRWNDPLPGVLSLARRGRRAAAKRRAARRAAGASS